MDRVAVFVDAGYLFAQGSIELSGEKLPRSEIKLDFGAVVPALRRFAEKVAKLPLLRYLLVRRDEPMSHGRADCHCPAGQRQSTARIRKLVGTAEGRGFPDRYGHDRAGPQ